MISPLPAKTLFAAPPCLETILAVEQKIQRIPEVARGWRLFEDRIAGWRRMRDATAARWTEVEANARRHGGNKVFTKGNFLRVLIHWAAENAFHHRLTGDPASLELAAGAADRLAAEPVWTAQAERNGWRSDLWTADFTASMAQVITFLEASGDVRRVAAWRRALVERGIRPLLADWVDPRERVHALDTMGHNWWSVCVSGAALGLFCARQELKEADRWLDRIADGFIEFFGYPGNVLQNKHRTFGRDGDSVEPLGYLDYTLHHALPVFDLYRRVFGRDLAAELPELEACADYYLATLQPLRRGMQRLNFGNMGWGPHSLGNERHSPVAVWLWLAGRYRRGEFLHLLRIMDRVPSASTEFLHWPEALVERDFTELPHRAIFRDSALAILRDGYERDATVFAIRAGETWNHNHADAGSFILSSGGTEFLIDPGTTEYTNPLNGTFFWSSEGHNVLLHDGVGQSGELHHLGTKFPGQIAAQLAAPGYRYVLADATGPWEGVYSRFYRHVLWTMDCIVLIDDLMAARPAPWTQLLHFRGAAQISAERTEIANEDKTLIIHHIHPPLMRTEIREGHLSRPIADPWKESSQLEKESYLAIHYPGRDRREKFLQVFELPDRAAKRVDALEGANFIGVRITTEERGISIYCNLLADGRIMHQNAWNRLGDWETDAFLLIVEHDAEQNLAAVALHNGSALRKGEDTVFSSLLKGDVRIAFADTCLRLFSSFSNTTWADIMVRAGSESKRVRLDAGEHAAEIAIRAA